MGAMYGGCSLSLSRVKSTLLLGWVNTPIELVSCVDTWYDRSSTFSLKRFLNDGAKSSEISFCFAFFFQFPVESVLDLLRISIALLKVKSLRKTYDAPRST